MHTCISSYLLAFAFLLSAACARPEVQTLQPDSRPETASAHERGDKDSNDQTPDVAVALFVVDATDVAGPPVPKVLQAANVCASQSCSLVAAPVLFGRSGFPMRIEIGNHQTGQMFRAQVYVRHAGRDLDIGFKGDVWGKGTQPQHLEYDAAVTEGELVHLGTLTSPSEPGADVYAVFAQGEPPAMRSSLDRWSSNG